MTEEEYTSLHAGDMIVDNTTGNYYRMDKYTNYGDGTCVWWVNDCYFYLTKEFFLQNHVAKIKLNHKSPLNEFGLRRVYELTLEVKDVDIIAVGVQKNLEERSDNIIEVLKNTLSSINCEYNFVIKDSKMITL